MMLLHNVFAEAVWIVVDSLAAGQILRDLLFRLVPSAAISRTIQDADGNPLPWAHVSTLREIYFCWRRGLASEVTVVTDDRGE